MAYKTIDEPEQGSGGKFFQFKAIGDAIEGYFAGTSVSTSQFAKEKDEAYTFLTKDGLVTIDPVPTNGSMKLNAAKRDGDLKPGCKVLLKFIGEKPTDKGNPMRIIEVKVDPEPNQGALKAIAKKKSETPKPPPPKPKNDDADLFDDKSDSDDIPF